MTTRAAPRVVAAAMLVTTAALASVPIGCDPKAETAAMIARGKALYEVGCGACHREGGRGAPGIAAPLEASPWVLGSPGRLVRIALHGVRGPIEVRGKTFNLEMPAFGHAYDDEDLAAILTYARQAWGNDAPAVTPQAVAAIRAETSTRGDSWTAEELLAIE